MDLLSPKTRKRSISNGEGPEAKRKNQAAPNPRQSPNAPKTTEQYIYIAIEEEFGPWRETMQELFKAYATVEDANRRLQARQLNHPDYMEWDSKRDKYGCWHARAEDLEGQGVNFEVRRMRVRPAGSAPPLLKAEDRKDDGFASQPSNDADEQSPQPNNHTTGKAKQT
ncbi:MAG: hypothetical protein Q9181_007106 [Wetmoreana brouardii]